jgi:glutamate N-acetyltransferase/amino-acid N-acetyltransferase
MGAWFVETLRSGKAIQSEVGMSDSVVRLDDPSITLVPGFRAAGVACGLKADRDLDLALISADLPCTAAALFTTNRVRAAPVLYDQALMDAGKLVQAVVINSGCANACTGQLGLDDVCRTSEWVGEALSCPADAVFVMSTGVIGQPLPMDKIAGGIQGAAQGLSAQGGHDAARAIMTTDTRPKEAAARVQIGATEVTISGMCKGAGMIHPGMATMLALLLTDAAVAPVVLETALKRVAERTFNMVTVDGDMSTNDTVLLLANGQAGNAVLADVDLAEYKAFEDGLLAVATELAQGLVRDGEGATKFVTIHVSGAESWAAAKQVAKSIATSTLVKTAIYGQDANWGRVICAAGYSGVDIDPERLCLRMIGDTDALVLVQYGAPFEIDEGRASVILAGDEVTFALDLGMGQAEATVWTCDLSHQYVDINAHYRT